MTETPNPIDRWRNRRRMAWLALLAGLSYPLLLLATYERTGRMKARHLDDEEAEMTDRYDPIPPDILAKADAAMTDIRRETAVHKPMSCKFRLKCHELGYHPGGTALRIETATPDDRCALRPLKDNVGRRHQPIRWVMSGGSPITVAAPCTPDHRCVLRVLAEIGGYGSSWAGPCPQCRRLGVRKDAGEVRCRECGTLYVLVERR